jgi:hypothetical protein
VLELDPDDVRQARLAGSLWRSYKNTLTGETVSVVLVCGRPGPVSVHTPEVCYAGTGYQQVSQAVRSEFRPPSPAPTAQLWTARFAKLSAPVPEQLQIYWSWNAVGTWEAPDNPRLVFARFPVLYKLYVLRETTADAPQEKDPGRDFLQQLLPALHQALTEHRTDSLVGT